MVGGCPNCNCPYCGTDCVTGLMQTGRTVSVSNVGYYGPPPQPEPVEKPRQPRLEKLRNLETFTRSRRLARPLALSRGVLPKPRGNC